MARGKRETTRFAPGEAKFILEHLVSAGLVKAGDVQEARRALEAEADTIQARLAALRAAMEHQNPTPTAAPRPARRRAARAARKRPSRAAAVPAAATVAAPAPGGSVPPATAPGRTRRPRTRRNKPAAISPERQKTMQLQGIYLGLMHKVPKTELARFNAMIPKIGKEAVIKKMEAYIKKNQG